NSAKSSAVNLRIFMIDNASASPSASIAVVDALGASPSGQASSIAPIFSTMSAARPRPLLRLAVTAMTGCSSFFTMLSRLKIAQLLGHKGDHTIVRHYRNSPAVLRAHLRLLHCRVHGAARVA